MIEVFFATLFLIAVGLWVDAERNAREDRKRLYGELDLLHRQKEELAQEKQTTDTLLADELRKVEVLRKLIEEVRAGRRALMLCGDQFLNGGQQLGFTVNYSIHVPARKNHKR